MSPFTLDFHNIIKAAADVKGNPDGKLDGERIISDVFTAVGGRRVVMVN